MEKTITTTVDVVAYINYPFFLNSEEDVGKESFFRILNLLECSTSKQFFSQRGADSE